MKVLLIGATGIIGKAIHEQLNIQNAEVITAALKSRSDFKVDYNSIETIEELFNNLQAAGHNNFDAIISVAGEGYLKPLEEHTAQDFQHGLQSKVLSQIVVVQHGQKFLKNGGVILVTSGNAARTPFPGTASISTSTAAIEAFVNAASLEIETFRLNAMAPSVVTETALAFGFPPDGTISAKETADKYISQVINATHGQVIGTDGH